MSICIGVRPALLTVVVLASSWWAASAEAQPTVPCPGGPTIIRNPDPIHVRSFGWNLDADGIVAVVAAHSLDNPNPTIGNGAHLYRLHDGQWDEEQVIPLDIALGDGFNSAVKVSGDTLAVRTGEFDYAIKIHRFDPLSRQWAFEQTITDPFPGNVEFGHSIALDDDVLAISAPGYPIASEFFSSGAVAIYRRQASTGHWVLEATLLADVLSKQSAYEFGYTVAIDDDVLVISTRDYNGVSVFERSLAGTWELKAVLEENVCPEDFWEMRRSLAVHGDTIVVGLPDFDGTPECGYAHGKFIVYERANGTWTQTFTAEGPPSSFTYLGYTVDVRDDLIAVGWPGDDYYFTDGGSAAIYGRTAHGWAFSRRLAGVSQAAVGLVGGAVAIGDTHVMVGWAHGMADVGEYSGAAVMYDRLPPRDDCNGNSVSDATEIDCNNSGQPDWCDIAVGASQDQNGNFIPDECEPPAVVRHESLAIDHEDYTWGSWFGHDASASVDRIAISIDHPWYGQVKVFMSSQAGASAGTEIAPPNDESGHFGSSLKLVGDVLVAAAPEYDQWRGAVAIYTNYSTPEVLVLPETARSPFVPLSIDVRSDLQRVVAARHDVHVFDRVGGAWSEHTIDVPCNPGAEHLIVQTSGNTIAALCRAEGRVHLFEFDGTQWRLSQTIDLGVGRGVGRAVQGVSMTLTEAQLACGVMGFEQCPADGGSVMMYRRTGATWTFEQEITAADTRSGDHFGYSVRMKGGSIAIGAPGHDGVAVMAGAAYLFHRQGGRWIQGAKLVPSNVDYNAQIGLAIDMRGDEVVVTSPFNSHNFAGSAYLFACDECESLSGADVTGDGVVNVADLLAVIGMWGPCSLPNDCPADIAPSLGGDAVVNVQDLLMVIKNWG